MKRIRVSMGALACWILVLGALCNGVRAAEMTAEQKDAVSKLQAKGGLVIPVAANTDALVVSLATAGKSAGDVELALVKRLPKVEQLDLRGTGITDGGLANIEGLTTLTHLHLESTAVTDEGVAHLKGLTNLTYLNLFNTAVTDKGVSQLSGLKSLKKLYLWQTKATAAGAAGLKKSLPELDVNRGEELAITTQPAQPEKKPEPKKAEEKKPAPPVVAAKPQDPIEAKIAEAKAAIDAQVQKAKADIDAKAAEAKASLDAKLTEVKAAAPVASAKPINSKCPVSGEPVDPARTVTYEGKVIGFCCDKCPAKFTADPKKYIDKVVADVK